MATTGRASVEIVADLTGFAAQLRRDINRALRTVRVDTRTLARTILRDLSRHLAGSRITITGLRLNLSGIRVDTDAIERALSGIRITITGIFINLTAVHVNSDAVGKKIGDGVLRGAARSLKGFGAMLAKAVVGAAAVSVLASAFGALTAQAIALVAAIAPAAGVIALLPAVILAAVATFGLLKAALSGFGDALKAAVSGDLEAFNEALEKLSPAARTVAREFFRLGPAIKTFQQSLQDNFFAHLTGQIEATGNALLGLSKSTAFIHITSLFGQAAARALEFGRSAETLTRLGGILENVAASVAPLTGALTPLLDAFLTIASVGAGFFPGLTSGAAEAAAAFANWTEEAEASGQIADIISTALSIIGDLGVVIGNVGSILKSVFSAGQEAGGGLLETLKTVTGAVAAFFASTEGQAALTSFFASAGAVISSLLPILQIVAVAIGTTIAPMIAALATAFTPGLSALVGGLAKGLAALAPAAGPVGKALGDIAAALAPLLPLLGTILANILTEAAGALQILAAALGPVISLVAGALTQAFAQLLPVITQLVSTVLPIAIQFGTALAAALAPLIPVIVQIAQALAGQLATILPQIAGMFAQILPHVIALVQQFGANLLTALTALAPHIPALAQGFIQFANAVIQLWTAMAPAVLDVFTTVLAELAPHLPELIEAFVRLALAGVQIMTAILPLIPLITDLVVLLIESLVESNTLGIGLGLLVGIIQGVVGIIEVVSAVISTAIGWFVALIGAVRTIGGVFRDVFGAIGGFISGAFNGAVDIAKSAINSIIDVVNGAIGGINEVLTTARNNVPGFNIGNIGQMPRLAQGGIAEAGRTHLVGERGPELFVPDRTGTVIPNNALGGPQVIENHIHIGDEVVRVVRTQIDGANRDLRRRVLAGAGAR